MGRPLTRSGHRIPCSAWHPFLRPSMRPLVFSPPSRPEHGSEKTPVHGPNCKSAPATSKAWPKNSHPKQFAQPPTSTQPNPTPFASLPRSTAPPLAPRSPRRPSAPRTAAPWRWRAAAPAAPPERHSKPGKNWLWVKNGYPKWNPGKWKQRRKPAVLWWSNFHPHPIGGPWRKNLVLKAVNRVRLHLCHNQNRSVQNW